MTGKSRGDVERRMRWNPRHWRPDVGLSLLLVPVTLYLCTLWGIAPSNDPTAYLVAGLLLFTVAAIPTVFIFFAASMVMRRRGSLSQARMNILALVGNILLIVGMSWIYTHLKAGVFTSGRSLDSFFQRIDRMLCDGQDPVLLAQAWIPPWCARPLAIVYITFLPVILGCILWLGLRGKQQESDDLTCSTVLAYYFGALIYHLAPAFGPAFTIAKSLEPGVNDAFLDIQRDLLANFHKIVVSPGSGDIQPWRFIGAFPSLHVTGVLIATWYMRHNRFGYFSMVCYSLLTAISTIYFGWHYIIDWVGGVAVAGISVWLTQHFRIYSKVHRRLAQSTPTQIVQRTAIKESSRISRGPVEQSSTDPDASALQSQDRSEDSHAK